MIFESYYRGNAMNKSDEKRAQAKGTARAASRLNLQRLNRKRGDAFEDV
jgi:hypothetical protein